MSLEDTWTGRVVASEPAHALRHRRKGTFGPLKSIRKPIGEDWALFGLVGVLRFLWGGKFCKFPNPKPQLPIPNHYGP